MWRVSRLDFYAASIALVAVLLLGILHGILLAALASIALLLMRVSRPHVAFLGRVPGTQSYSDAARHPDNELPRHAIVVRPEASLIYVNAAAVLEAIQSRIKALDSSVIRVMICDLSASAFIDLAGSRMLHELHGELDKRGIALRIVGARSYVRDFLRADGLGDKIGPIDRAATIHELVSEAEQ
jgi:MFS superfamily sulfate permease-like transporter